MGKAVVIPTKIAVMAVDPGATTGLAGALLNLGRASTTKQLLRRAVKKGAFDVNQISGEPEKQAWDLYKKWIRFLFRAHVEAGVPYPHIYLVIEQFQLRQRDAELWPVEITSGLLAILRGEVGTWPSLGRKEHQLRFQTPSQAMGYATNERLRDWGVWTVAKEHGRDATRHLALLASRALQGELTDPVRTDPGPSEREVKRVPKPETSAGIGIEADRVH